MKSVTLRAIFASFLVVFPLLTACGRDAERDPSSGPPAATAKPALEAAPASLTRSTRRSDLATAPRIIVLGDSLTAGLGLPVEESFPSLIQQRLDKAGLRYLVLNAGVSGDTSAGGLRRLDFSMTDGDPKVLIVALGGNDGLRGLQPEQLERNLAAIIERAQSKGLRVILAGMEAPPNFGQEYATQFRQAFRDVALQKRVLFLPFLLNNVAGKPELNQADGIHPNQQGTRIVADNVWTVLEPLLDQMSGAS
jgi:acyl-CoA thioesterase I